jgi:hypothetical protein
MDEREHEAAFPRKGTDWKAVLAAGALFWTVAFGLGGLFRSHILGAVDERIATHAVAAAATRAQFLRDIESRSDGALGRLSQLEERCAVIRDWRTATDGQLAGLQDWRTRCGQKVERILAWLDQAGDDLRELELKTEKLKEQIDKNGGKR